MVNCLLPRKKAVFLLANLSIRSTSLQAGVWQQKKKLEHNECKKALPNLCCSRHVLTLISLGLWLPVLTEKDVCVG
jgi:hypothetical protein